MPLDEYRRKRDFAKTPEPAPGSTSGGSQPGSIVRRRFVVQRHRATRLHYDFRLEIDGVLASWAVPKGPTLDPSIRRMAVHVEDHPLEYFDFEGVIPARQYGAGDVIVWDWGTWEPEAETPDPAAAVANGELKFVLSGEKVTGRYTIVRTSRRPGSAPEHGVRGRRWRAVAADPQARRGQRRGLGRRGPPTERQVGADQRRGQGQRPGDLGLGGARVDRRDRPVRRPRGADAALPRADEGDARDPGVPRRGLAVRAQVGRLPGRGRRPRRQGRAVHPQRPRRRGVLPEAADSTDVDRSREAIVDGEVVALDERGHPDFSLLQERISEGRARRRCRWSTRPSTCCTSTAVRSSTCRSSRASGCSSW